jgi:pyridinium-3,5-bisthiocarboxylic acid mononucleotide nickel chelatase
VKALHFDSVGGASGDMILGVLADLGVDPAALNAALTALGAGEIRIEARPHADRALRGTQVTVHAHDAAHGHHGAGHHGHRTLRDIRPMIEGSGLPEAVKRNALAVFQRLAEAEARVHGTTPEEVHFHEVGALDALADITGACLGLHLLGVTAVSFSPLPCGHGTIESAHGILPNPPPATVELLRGFPTVMTDEPFELVTPTGAALLTAWGATQSSPAGTVAAVGHGFGHRRLNGRPNVLRGILLDSAEAAGPDSDACLVLETNLDDTNPEWVGALVQKLLAAGAFDAFTASIQMKKQRPGMLLTVLCAPERKAAILDLIFTESTTFGVREHWTRRTMLAREFAEVQTRYGAVRIKIGRWQGRSVTQSPEYEDCARGAEAHRVPVRVVYAAALEAFRSAGAGSHV